MVGSACRRARCRYARGGTRWSPAVRWWRIRERGSRSARSTAVTRATTWSLPIQSGHLLPDTWSQISTQSLVRGKGSVGTATPIKAHSSSSCGVIRYGRPRALSPPPSCITCLRCDRLWPVSNLCCVAERRTVSRSRSARGNAGESVMSRRCHQVLSTYVRDMIRITSSTVGTRCWACAAPAGNQS